MPIIITGNGLHKNQLSKRPVGLIDLYTTLLELCGLAKDEGHEGQSLKPLLEKPDREWATPVRTTFGLGNHAIKSTRWRYIKYVDGSEVYENIARVRA